MSPKVDSRRETLSSSLEINEQENKSGWNNNSLYHFWETQWLSRKTLLNNLVEYQRPFVFETLIVRQWGKLNRSNEADHYRAALLLSQSIQTLPFSSERNCNRPKESFVFISTLQVQTICLGVFVCLGPKKGHSQWTHSGRCTFLKARTQRFIWTVWDVVELVASQPRRATGLAANTNAKIRCGYRNSGTLFTCRVSFNVINLWTVIQTSHANDKPQI